MYSENNTAKEYILRAIASKIKTKGNLSVLDFACGTCLIWTKFFHDHEGINFFGFDFNAESIKIAQEKFPHFKDNILLLDGQKELPFDNQFDIITTFSSLEHVFDKYSFLKNVKSLLNKDGIAYLNYDSGHFKGNSIQDLYNLTSQALAYTGITERFFTQEVKISEIKEILKKLNLEIIGIRYFNLIELKHIHKKIKDTDSLNAWYEYELSLNSYSGKNILEKIFSSVVIEVKNHG